MIDRDTLAQESIVLISQGHTVVLPDTASDVKKVLYREINHATTDRLRLALHRFQNYLFHKIAVSITAAANSMVAAGR
jgi:hypothetical protein